LPNTASRKAALASDVKLWLFDGKIVELGLWRQVADVFVGNNIRHALQKLTDPQARFAPIEWRGSRRCGGSPATCFATTARRAEIAGYGLF
jgi:hypothetical protein